jgi:outer membrane receptor protein involved in Fe transport
LSNGAPLNDPFGGWIHWNEIPPEAIEAVTIASGGGSDLYGSSALGGVIDVLPGRPGKDLAELSASGAGEDTASASGRADLRQSHWGELAAGQYFRTDGYILTAPTLRGPIDIPANVHFETGRAEFDRQLGENGRAFLIGNLLNEARGNGTPDQTNATRLWRYLAGDEWTGPGSVRDRLSGRIRLFGSDEAYRQSFSAIAANRASETLTRLQHVETQEVGGSADASYHRSRLAFVAGADVRDIRATDLETPIAAGVPSGLQDTTARQRFYGGFGEALAERGPWSGTVSLRADRARNLAASTLLETVGSSAATTPVSGRSEVVLSPRVGLDRRLGSQFNLHASAFRAFRSPTMNELYRTGQVGQETTLANSALVSERATGAEGGVGWTQHRIGLDVTYFWTEINRPVSAVLLRSTATTITEMRENLGQIQSQGVQLDARINEGHGLSANFGYQYAHAVVTAFSAQPALVGNWIPDVPRESATAQIRAQNRRLGSATLALRESGRAYDDSANTFLLHSFFTMALYGERTFATRWTFFAGAENLLDRKVDVARTPILTLGTPFLAQGGVRFRLGGN